MYVVMSHVCGKLYYHNLHGVLKMHWLKIVAKCIAIKDVQGSRKKLSGFAPPLRQVFNYIIRRDEVCVMAQIRYSA